jgi:hypothetical protein
MFRVWATVLRAGPILPELRHPAVLAEQLPELFGRTAHRTGLLRPVRRCSTTVPCCGVEACDPSSG